MGRYQLTGYTLVELILTVVILAVAVSGSITILGGMARHSTDAERQTLAIEYGRMRMEQILSKRFHETLPATYPVNCLTIGAGGALGPDGVETETSYNDVDDFMTSPSPPATFDGEIATDPLAGIGFKTNVQVEYADPEGADESWTTPVAGSTCYKRITVEVVDTRTNQILMTVRTLVSPYK